jgi:hypothetical protein
MKIITHIKANNKRQNILSSVIGQMSDGIWENTRSMEKYWKSLDFGVDASGYIWLEDRNGVTADVYDFFANKIKKIIQVEIEDGNTSLLWSRTCASVPHYFHGKVTVGDCYEMYELLKGRNTVKNRYATYSDYEVKLNYGGTEIVLLVDALNEYDARKVAAEKLIKSMTATITKV